MERPPGIPEEFWHNESPIECLRFLEETARFFWEMSIYNDASIYLDPDWREQLGALTHERANEKTPASS